MGLVDAKFHSMRLLVVGCMPHYRRPIAEIIMLRKMIAESLRAKGVSLPIYGKIHLSVCCRRHEHNGSDLQNIVQAVCQAIDGNTLGKADAILDDDGQINSLSARWIP